MSIRDSAHLAARLTIFLAMLGPAFSQVPLRDDNSGPYNVTILEGGEGITRPLPARPRSRRTRPGR
jgi:hypothetical protein